MNLGYHKFPLTDFIFWQSIDKWYSPLLTYFIMNYRSFPSSGWILFHDQPIWSKLTLKNEEYHINSFLILQIVKSLFMSWSSQLILILVRPYKHFIRVSFLWHLFEGVCSLYKSTLIILEYHYLFLSSAFSPSLPPILHTFLDFLYGIQF